MRHFRSLSEENEVRHKKLVEILAGTSAEIAVKWNTSNVAEDEGLGSGDSGEEFTSPSDE